MQCIKRCNKLPCVQQLCLLFQTRKCRWLRRCRCCWGLWWWQWWIGVQLCTEEEEPARAVGPAGAYSPREEQAAAAVREQSSSSSSSRSSEAAAAAPASPVPPPAPAASVLEPSWSWHKHRFRISCELSENRVMMPLCLWVEWWEVEGCWGSWGGRRSTASFHHNHGQSKFHTARQNFIKIVKTGGSLCFSLDFCGVSPPGQQRDRVQQCTRGTPSPILGHSPVSCGWRLNFINILPVPKA